MEKKKVIPIFFGCDLNFFKFTVVTLKSIIDNASKDYHYNVYVFNTDIDQEAQDKCNAILPDNFTVFYPNVNPYLEEISDRLPIRDYYSKTTYFRLFIAEMYPEYDKAIYIDADTIVQGDISELYNHELGDNLVGACNEQAMVQTDCYGTYVEKCLGLDRNHFFNAGMLVINSKLWRDECVLDQFVNLLSVYECKVTQDEDYLNIICKDRVLWIDNSWNVETYGDIKYDENTAKMVHYIMWGKPWNVKDAKFASIWWSYAEKTPYINEINAVNAAYDMSKIEIAKKQSENLAKLAVEEANKKDTFVAMRDKLGIKSLDRLKIQKKIREYEKEGKFDQDVEQDPPTKELLPDKIDYEKKKVRSKVKTKAAYFLARKFLNKMVKNDQIIIKEVKGVENLQYLESGAILTCNHFNAFDSFAIQVAYEESIKTKKERKKKKFFRVIREGNYTSFGGFYGFLMRNCYTLPLSSNTKTMTKFIRSITNLLHQGHLVLVYPEQSMWWNYRKPKPLKKGAFQFAVGANVPVVPCFITMEDTDKIGPDGYPIQEYTIHIEKPIYPDSSKSKIENVNYLMNENYRVWKEIYESVYHVNLTYTTKEEVRA
ncbi:MAG: 1-acyl-sn-glycerol-3-phosphate acyltransferase [Acholeplasmatales bacterium]|nr:1-acyl-sn-glycerol-3-phosphate acyltransferase [Acholeplasmatales bacterium]